MNPMLGMLNTSKLSGLASNLAPIKNMFSSVKAAQDPYAMLQQMAANNPQMQQAIDLIQQSGGDPQRAFYSLADKLGVDPQEVLKMLG